MPVAVASPAWAQDDVPASNGDAYDDEAVTSRPEATDQQHLADEEGSLSAGGLQAPDALGETLDEQSEIEEQLEEADRRDSGRGLEFVWLQGEIGFQHVDLQGLSSDNLAPGADTSGAGVAYGGALGLKLLYFTAGARFRMGHLDAFDIWSLAFELGMKLPLGKFEPYAALGIGYTAVPSLAPPDLAASETTQTIDGADLRLSLGGDYYVSDFVSFGFLFGGDFLFLKRGPYSSGVPTGSDYLQPGSSVGAGITLSATVGFHF